jgi:uncharacterized membrane-anchored protein
LIKGTAKIDHKTKNLVKRLKAGEIAIISHRDIDEVAARLLLDKRPRAVINTESSITGIFPTKGVFMLLTAGITVIDDVTDDIFDIVKDGDILIIDGSDIYKDDRKIGCGVLMSKAIFEARMAQADKSLKLVLDRFIDNTLEHAKTEKAIILEQLDIPLLTTNIKGRHVLTVIRGRDYKDDLKAIKSYIDEIHPVIIGVDGGADAVLECGYIPDIIIGDMDSVSDIALKKAKEIIVHAYINGAAPGMERVDQLGLKAHIFSCIGTSEDAALMLAYEKGADLIVAVGSHSNVIDFLEKGRNGMASTLLTRMKIGYKLVDAKGVNKLYNSHIRLSHVVGLIAAALFPVIMVTGLSPAFQQLYKLLLVRFQILLGW